MRIPFFQRERDLTKWVETTLGWPRVVFAGNTLSTNGTPDRLFWAPRTPGVWCELKRFDGVLSPLQVRWARDAHRASVGLRYLVLRGGAARGPWAVEAEGWQGEHRGGLPWEVDDARKALRGFLLEFS